jgi:hypothetical protein
LIAILSRLGYWRNEVIGIGWVVAVVEVAILKFRGLMNAYDKGLFTSLGSLFTKSLNIVLASAIYPVNLSFRASLPRCCREFRGVLSPILRSTLPSIRLFMIHVT